MAKGCRRAVGVCGRAKRVAGGVPASEASLPPKASYKFSDGEALRVLRILSSRSNFFFQMF